MYKKSLFIAILVVSIGFSTANVFAFAEIEQAMEDFLVTYPTYFYTVEEENDLGDSFTKDVYLIG